MASGKKMNSEQTVALSEMSKLAGEVNKGLNELIASVSDKSVMLTKVTNKANAYLAGINNSGV